MKKIFLALFATVALLGAGCAKIDVAEGQLNVPEGEMAVNLGISAPFGDAVRSYVSGTENPINGPIHMLCFDGEGKFIADRTGTVTKATDWSGTLAGTVPAITTRIHFIANFGSLDLSSFSIGSLERAMMKSEALSSGINDEVRFWGYHKAANSTEMMGWLTGGNTVKLLRDRAKVVLVKNLESGADAISELAWTVGNGVSRGFVAATSASGNDPYDNNYESNNRLTEFSSAGRYATMEGTDDAIWAGENEPQFLFENANTTSNPAKIIIRAKYADKTVKYHTVLLQSNENVLYPVVRNQTFKLTVKNLPKSVGSNNLTDALSTTNYSNNPYAQVAREVDEVNSEQFTLKVESVAKLFDNRGVDIDDAGNAIIRFTYTGHDGGSISSLTPANFDVSWEAKSSQDETDDVVAQDAQNKLVKPTVASFNATTGEGVITFPLAELSAALKHNTLQIVAKNSGLSRFVDVYSITSFKYATDPELADNKTSRPVGSESREVYKLTFSLPDLPESQYPLKVKLYTSTLVPFSDKSADAPSGSFNVVVDKTSSLSGSSQETSWNFGAPDWGQYYEYVIEQKPSAPSYTIYLYDIVSNYSRDINTVGLYFQIDGFQNASNVSCIPLSCVYNVLLVSPMEQTVAWNTTSAAFRVKAPAGTSWTITPGSGVTVNPTTSGTGNRDITLSFGTNNTTAARTFTATLSASGFESKTITVRQSAGASFTASNFTTFRNYSSSATRNGVKVELANSSKSGSNLTIGYQTYGWDNTAHQGTITVTPPSGKTITSIVVLYRGNNYTYNSSQKASSNPASYTVSGSTGIWSGAAAAGGAVTITMGYTEDDDWDDYYFPQITGIDVSYE